MTLQRGSPVFGRTLQQVYQARKGGPPDVFTESLALLQQGISNPGLFNKQGDRKKVQLLQKAWDQGRNPLRLAKIHDYCAVSDCLLNWLNGLPSPVIPCRLFHAFIHVHQTCSHSQWIFQLHSLLNKLEPCESEVIIPLLSFLHDYEQFHRGKSFRNPSLGQVFGPTLLKAHDQALPMPFPEDTRTAASLVDCMIADYDLIFRPPQSPCSSPVKKPPCRAKTSPSRKELACWKEESNSSEEKKKQQFAARMVRLDEVPVRHLRINVAAPLQDENCQPANCGSSERSFLTQLLQEGHPNIPRPISAFHSIPEEEADQGGDVDLDDVVGNLLCGSLSGMLFEPNDQKFLERTTSSATVSSPCVSCYQSEIGTDSIGSISDEELVQFCH